MYSFNSSKIFLKIVYLFSIIILTTNIGYSQQVKLVNLDQDIHETIDVKYHEASSQLSIEFTKYDTNYISQT